MPDNSLYAIVLLSALAHAAWNALVKSSADRLLTLVYIRIVGLIAGLIVVWLVPAPSSESVPYLAAAAVVHYLYYALMLNAYRVGDLSQVYPISRGVAPPVVALLAATFAGEMIGPKSALAVFVLSAGIILLAMSGNRANPKAIAFAVLTGIAIAGYTFLSGLGVRKSGSLLGYNAWLEIAAGSGMVVFGYARRGAAFPIFICQQWRAGLMAGLLSVSGYSIALWAMSVLPMAPVVALRETSVVFGALVGAVALREGFAMRRTAAAVAVLTGIVLLGAGSSSGVAAPTGIVQARELCTLVVESTTGQPLHKAGTCSERFTPASTFKIAISLMGFDAGFLVDEHTPALPFREGYADWLPAWRATTDPTTWIKNSVVWYSQRVTQTLGEKRFGSYVREFGYGNEDVSGTVGKHDGLTEAWLSSSLQISPEEQVAFLRRVQSRSLPVSAHACDMTERILTVEDAPAGWSVYGKTGSGYPMRNDHSPDREHALGWFVGWARGVSRSVTFAHLIQIDGSASDAPGPKARASLMRQLPDLLSDKSGH